jgi:hypothetical protein
MRREAWEARLLDTNAIDDRKVEKAAWQTPPLPNGRGLSASTSQAATAAERFRPAG